MTAPAQSLLDWEHGINSGATPGLRVIQSLMLGPLPVIDVTRNSLNDATDLNEVTLATMVVPGGVLKLGSSVEVFAIFENTNSALVKTFNIRINGTGMSVFTNTINQSYGIRQPFHVHDANNVLELNNGSVGTGAFSGLTFSKTIADVVAAGFTITLTCKWSAAALGEFIRLKHGKFKIIY